ncbi:hypothetical protein N8T08_002454 [Aspergillus melleus]|uniref:Uncharacterized protein n=1 Tax=Aspergillus melleus TaxID=138277 RepID=A0ACC3ALX1_9EURO|nr:hypothetical protein N8T08_002454 [Aspergillus melleus]
MDSINTPSEKIEYARQDAPESLSSGYASDQQLVRSLLLKLDTRTNIGNAKVLGFEEDLNITNHQYDIGLTVYYLTYVLR